MRKLFSTVMTSLLFCLPLQAASSSDVLTVKTIGLDLARDIAGESIRICRKQGYQISAVIVDRNGLLRVALRDDLAARFTLQLAEDKANSVILSNTSSGELRKNRGDIRNELNQVDGIIILQGALVITSAGSNLGAIGVSGAPGGDKDEACAKQALDKFQERLEFAD